MPQRCNPGWCDDKWPCQCCQARSVSVRGSCRTTLGVTSTRQSYFQNLIAALTPVLAMTEADQCLVFDCFHASVETHWSNMAMSCDRMHSRPRLLQAQVHVYLPMSHRHLNFRPLQPKHRRAGSSRIFIATASYFDSVAQVYPSEGGSW